MACSKLSLEKEVLMKNRENIIKYLDADDIINDLIHARLVSESTPQDLIGKSKVDKNRIIYEQLINAESGALEKFREVLNNQRRQTPLTKQLGKRELTRITRCIVKL